MILLGFISENLSGAWVVDTGCEKDLKIVTQVESVLLTPNLPNIFCR